MMHSWERLAIDDSRQRFILEQKGDMFHITHERRTVLGTMKLVKHAVLNDYQKALETSREWMKGYKTTKGSAK